MFTDRVDARAFYESEIGQAAQELLRKHASKLCPLTAGEKVLPLGSASLLQDWQDPITARIDPESFSSIVDSRGKPLADASLDLVAALHTDADIDLMLREIWRVLKGEGRLLLIVPKLNGAWAQNAATPFAQETAYTARQIAELMRKHFFFVRSLERALYAPPSWCAANRNIARELEIIAPWLMLRQGGGVLIVEAQKRICGAVGCRTKRAKIGADPLFPLPLPI